LVSGLLEQSNSFSLIQRMIEDAKALEDFAENFENLDDFYNNQFQTWQALIKALNDQFKANRPALEKDESAKKRWMNWSVSISWLSLMTSFDISIR